MNTKKNISVQLYHDENVTYTIYYNRHIDLYDSFFHNYYDEVFRGEVCKISLTNILKCE